MTQFLRGLKIPLFLFISGLFTFLIASSWVEEPPNTAAAEKHFSPSQPFDVLPTSSTPETHESEQAFTENTAIPVAHRGVYLTANVAGIDARLDDTIDRSLQFGFNAIVIDVKDNSGTVAYASEVGLAKQIGAVVPRFSLRELVERVRSKGLYFIARLVVFSDPKLAKHLGKKDEWVLPSNGEAVAYNLAIAEEVAASGVDEIQFDYIRFPDDGKIGNAYPKRTAAIVNFLQQAQRRLSDKVKLSADVFGRTLWDWNPKGIDPVGQVLERMSPYVAYLSPMIYPSHYEPYFRDRPYEVVQRGMTIGLERGLSLRPFLQAFDLRIPSEMSYTQYIRDQLKALDELNVNSYLFWNPRGDYSSLWKALAQE